MPFKSPYAPSGQYKKGPSVSAVRAKSEDGKVKVSQILTYGPKENLDDAVEQARAAMQQAGEAPRGDPKEAKGGSSSDQQTRWAGAARPSTTVVIPKSSSPAETPVVRQGVQPEAPGGFDIVFKYSDGNEEIFHTDTRAQMIQGVKRRQAQLMAKGLKAEVTITEVGVEEEPVKTVLGEETVEVAPEPSVRGTGGSVRTEPQIEKLENSKFTLEIFQEDGEWVGRISYKNGAGTEEFRADTRKALDMKLLEGKAHATLKVREVLRRDQFHDDLDKVYDIPGYTQETFDALTPEAQTLVIDAIASKEALAFRESTPEFYGVKENTDMLTVFLHKRNLPMTYKNLKYAFEELADDLVPRPQPKVSTKVEEKPAPSAPPVVADSTPKPVAIEPASAAQPAPVQATERKRGWSSGFKPGFTSSGNTGLEEAEGGTKSAEPSEKELRSMSIEELAKIVRLKYGRGNRQF